MDLVEEQLGMFQCIIQSEGNGAENESEISGIWQMMKRIRTELLGYRVIAIERWRIG